MLKKAAILGLLWIYTIGVSGIAVSAHYCCGELVGIRVNFPAKDCGQASKPNCCQDFTHFWKIADSHSLLTDASSVWKSYTPAVGVVYRLSVMNLPFWNDCADPQFANSPPFSLLQIPLYLRHSVWRI